MCNSNCDTRSMYPGTCIFSYYWNMYVLWCVTCRVVGCVLGGRYRTFDPLQYPRTEIIDASHFLFLTHLLRVQ